MRLKECEEAVKEIEAILKQLDAKEEEYVLDKILGV